MEDGGRGPERGLSAEVGVPYVVAEQVAGGGLLGLLVICFGFAWLG